MKSVFLDGALIDYREITTPALFKDWARIEVYSVGICGTDVSKIQKQNLPLNHTKILGHEFIGKVVKINGKNNLIYVDDFVVCMPIIYCGTCEMCIKGMENLCLKAEAIGRTIQGGFAEYVDVPIENLIKIKKELFCDTYVLADPIAVCLHAIKLANNVSLKEKKVLIIGDGSIGCILSWLLVNKGINVTIMGKHSENISFAKSLGVSILEDTYKALNTFDEIYETVGRHQNDTLNIGIKLIKQGGTLIVLGVYDSEYMCPLSSRELFIKESKIIGVNAYTKDDFIEAVKIINENRNELDIFISHIFSLKNFSDALKVILNKNELTLKVILKPKILLP